MLLFIIGDFVKFKNKKNVQFNSKMENKDDLYSNDIVRKIMETPNRINNNCDDPI